MCGRRRFKGPEGLLTNTSSPLAFPHDLHCIVPLKRRPKDVLPHQGVSSTIDKKGNVFKCESLSHVLRDILLEVRLFANSDLLILFYLSS